MAEALPFDQMQAAGLLWLFNRACLHPRGFALAFHYDTSGAVVGWELQGDGSEPWAFDEVTDDLSFARVEAFLASHRNLNT